MDIRLEHLSKSFGEKQLLRELNAVFPEGSVSAVLAPSGKGKTTLLRILLGLEKADGGTVSGMPEKISVLFQEDRLFPQLDAAQNIRALAPADVGEREISALLEKLGIGEALHRDVKVLSGGMARRVAIARALLAQSDILLLDEPFRGLDADTRAVTARTVLEYSQGKTVILFAHGREEAELLGAVYISELN